MARLVVKFGGTSVGSAAAMRQAASIVSRLRGAGHEVVVVTSAMSGVTDALLGIASAAVTGDHDRLQTLLDTLRARHHDAAQELVPGLDERRPVAASLDRSLDDLALLAEALGVLGEASPRALDAVASLGERMSIHLLAAAVRAAGVEAEAVDAVRVVQTDDTFQAAAPNMDATRERAEAVLRPLILAGRVPVVAGFIGATPDGVVTTLGRGGSDYSAAIVASVVDADEAWIYTDVDGVMTSDPRVVPEARTIAALSYSEMSELAYFGAKVLHPRTVLPALERGIPILIRNTFNPDHAGTRILGRGDDTPGMLKAVTAIERQGLVTIQGRGMLGIPGIAARAFGAVARSGTSISMISQASSEQSICFLVPQAAAATVIDALCREFEHELARKDIESIWSLNDAIIVTVVGEGLKRIPGVAGRIFGALGQADVNVIAIAMGSSECSLSLVVEAGDAERAVRSLHPLMGLS